MYLSFSNILRQTGGELLWAMVSWIKLGNFHFSNGVLRVFPGMSKIHVRMKEKSNIWAIFSPGCSPGCILWITGGIKKNIRSSCDGAFSIKSFQNFHNIYRKTPAMESIFSKVTDLRKTAFNRFSIKYQMLIVVDSLRGSRREVFWKINLKIPLNGSATTKSTGWIPQNFI